MFAFVGDQACMVQNNAQCKLASEGIKVDYFVAQLSGCKFCQNLSINFPVTPSNRREIPFDFRINTFPDLMVKSWS